jgi:hypothetical protein
MVNRLLPYILAFAATVVAVGTFTYFSYYRTQYPPNRLEVATHGHNAEAREALLAAHIPDLQIFEAWSAPSHVFNGSLLLTALSLAPAFLVFFAALFVFRRLLRGL